MDILKTIILPLVLAIFASTGFWNWLSQRKASNRDILTAIKDLSSRLTRLEQRVEQNEENNIRERAEQARVRLLRFNGELLRGVKHTEEEFFQALSDIDIYEKFCKANPEYPNSRAVMAIANIKRCYDQCLQQHDFL